MYSSLAHAETGGEVDPWIRTRARPEGGSSAYGPVQLTKGFVNDFTSRRTGEFTPQQLATASNLSGQADKFLQYGGESELEGYEPKWDYGGSGSLTTDVDKSGYKDLAKQLIRMQWQASGNDATKFLQLWRGKTPEVSFSQRFMSQYNPHPLAQ